MRNYMQLNRLTLLGIVLVVLLSWWAHGSVTSKTTNISKELEGGVVPVQYQQHYQMNVPNEMHCLPCPPCPVSQLPPPRRIGPPSRSQNHHHGEKKAHLPPETHVSPENKSTNTSEKESAHKAMAMKVVKICGNVLSASPLLLPFVIYWTTGNLDSTIRFYTKVTLGTTGLSSYTWLAYSLLQVSYEDKEQVIGVEAIVLNAISWAVLAFMFMFLVMKEGLTGRGKRCIVGLIIQLAFTMGLIQFPILRLFRSDGAGKHIVGGIAAAFQVSSEVVPLILLWKTWGHVFPVLRHPEGPAIRNYKKITVFARAVDSLVTLYWMQFCISTYKFDEFGIGNIVSAALSLISFIAHSGWALKPGQ